MSNFEADVEIAEFGAEAGALTPSLEILTARSVPLGPRQHVRRVLPNRERRMIGPWCFADHYGPADITREPKMWVPPHPHTCLQTVSWLFAGEVQHDDSLSSHAVVLPGQLALMTAGAGIAHSEISPDAHSTELHGLQLWVALPDEVRLSVPPAFDRYADLPRLRRPGLRATAVLGELEGQVSSASAYSPIVGAELEVDGEVSIRVRPDFEHGVLCVGGALRVEGRPLGQSEVGYLGGGRDVIALGSDGPARGFLLGGEPFTEDLVMWWNFIGRDHDEIVRFRELWNAGSAQFGEVAGFPGERLLAPPMPTVRLRPRGRHR
ncbi:MAG TPA: pirin family protein [Nocardioidaceae bacterium]|nr:pirin family protein [Nocardioidaceae bacterium]